MRDTSSPSSVASSAAKRCPPCVDPKFCKGLGVCMDGEEPAPASIAGTPEQTDAPLFVRPDGQQHGVQRVCVLCGWRSAGGEGGALAAHAKKHVRAGEAYEGSEFYAKDRFHVGQAPAGTSSPASTPQPGEMLQQGVAFNAVDIWNAYEAGARDAYETLQAGIPAGQTFAALVRRSADAYTKLSHSMKPRSAEMSLFRSATPEQTQCVECGATDTALERGADGQMRCVRRSRPRTAPVTPSASSDEDTGTRDAVAWMCVDEDGPRYYLDCAADVERAKHNDRITGRTREYVPLYRSPAVSFQR